LDDGSSDGELELERTPVSMYDWGVSDMAADIENDAEFMIFDATSAMSASKSTSKLRTLDVIARNLRLRW
jgi:hypothetical protein